MDGDGRWPRAGRTRLVTCTIVAFAALAACSSGSAGTAPPTRTTAPSLRPSPTPASTTLADLARRGAATSFTATYTLDSTEVDQPDATVRIARRDTSYRVEVDSGSSRAVLLTARAGVVSCQLGSKLTCLLVAKPGATPPSVFDPGVQRLVTTDLHAFASPSGLSVEATRELPAVGELAAASCFAVTGPGVDQGEYCLTDDGTLRQATFPSGTLTLTTMGGPPTAATFEPPVSPTPLPTS